MGGVGVELKNEIFHPPFQRGGVEKVCGGGK
jgi:hypothetical protein